MAKFVGPDDDDYDDYEAETYGEFLERTGLEDTEQHYQMFISGEYSDDDYF